MVQTSRPSPRVARKRERRRQHMCQVAGRIVRAEGLDSLTISRLASELDCSVGSIYTYFPSKEALLAELTGHAVEVLTEAFERTEPVWSARLRRDRGRAGDPAALALTSLLAFYEFFAAAAEEMPEEFTLLRLALTEPRRLVADAEVPRAFDATSRLVRIGADLLVRAESAGAIGPGDAVERLFLWAASAVTLLGLGKLSRYGVAGEEPAALGRRLTVDLLAGWGADPRALDDALARVRSLRRAGLFSPSEPGD